ncbi:MAG: murein biosynthesis integral membrane protein MurJ [Phycisphaerales bacterium]|nr:murein biosynthesis integral membrane protein MurJ [Phycisphaerales bacterium]
MSDGLERNTRTVMVLTGISRVAGLARDATVSRLLGTGDAMGAFWLAFLIPNLFRRLFGEGALSAAFLPAYQRLVDEDPRRAAALAGGLIGGLAVVLGAIVVLGEAVLFLVSSSLDHTSPAIWLTMVTLPYMPLVCLVAIIGAMLHVHGRFGPTAAAPLILNGCLISAAVLGWWWFGTSDSKSRIWVVSIMAGSVVLAGCLQLAWSVLTLRGQANLQLDLASAMSPMRDVIRRAGPMIFGLGVLQINTLFDGLIASYPLLFGDTIAGRVYPLDEQAMAVISFAHRLYQFPLGVFGIAVATAIYPLLAKRGNNSDSFGETVRRGIRFVLFIGVPAGIGLMVVREPLTAVILQGGNFGVQDTDRVSFVLLGYAASVWAYALVQVLTRAFYARDEVMTPVRIAMVMVGLNLLLNLTLIWTPLREAGLAWSTSICAAIQAVVMLWVLQRRGLSLRSDGVPRAVMQIVVLTAIMALSVWGAGRMLGDSTEWLWSLIKLLVLVSIGGVVYILGAMAMRMRELRWILGRGSDSGG